MRKILEGTLQSQIDTVRVALSNALVIGSSNSSGSFGVPVKIPSLYGKRTSRTVIATDLQNRRMEGTVRQHFRSLSCPNPPA